MISANRKAVLCFAVLIFCSFLSPQVYSSGNQPTSVERHHTLSKPLIWGNDVLIASGPIEGGIAADYDTAGNLYAARCSTVSDKAVQSTVIVYKSTVNGASWFKFCQYGPFAVTFSYPVILTGSIGNRLYVFVLGSQNNGEVWMARFNAQTGGFETSMGVATGVVDTISYFTACTNMGRGDTIVVVYQKDRAGDTPYLYSTMSTDYGITWSPPQLQSYDGEHPDIAYGQGGNVYLAYHKTEKDDIGFLRGKTYETGMWNYFEFLTTDTTSHHNDFPKIAALHTSPADTTTVWVVYNHTESVDKFETIDLRFAYSTNSGVDWTKDQILANDPDFDEKAADLKVFRSPTSTVVDLCYVKIPIFLRSTLDVCYTWADASSPDQFNTPQEKVNDYDPNWSPDGRRVCQLTFVLSSELPGVVYAGPLIVKGQCAGEKGGWNLYFDYKPWTDVEEDVAEEELPAQFSLSINYPNPFNPVTRIQYTVNSKQIHPIPISLKIYNVLGQLVRILANEPKEQGNYEVVWDGRNENGNEVASGVYFYKLEAENFSQTKKMVLIR